MGESFGHFFASLTFYQFLILLGIAFAMIVTLIIVLARFARMSGIDEIKAGPLSVDFDTTAQKRPRRRVKAVKK